MKISMFGHKRIPSREGGVEIVVEELSSRMVALGHDVTCYNRKGHHVGGKEYDNMLNTKTHKGVVIKHVFTVNFKGLAAFTSSLFSAINTAFSSSDIVHIHAEGPASMCWIPKAMGKKVVVTIHGLDWNRAKWGGLATKYIKFGEREAVKRADEIIVLSKGIQEYFQKKYGRETVFIPNGVIRPEMREADEIKKLWGLEKDSYVLFLGRIVPEKGLGYLVEAWKGIKTDKKLVIVGGSSDTHKYMAELRAMSPKNIIFTGFQQGRVLGEWYSNAYVYCHPSDLEGMPLSLLEAMSYGNCCVVSDITECTEVVEDKAIVFKKSNVDELRKTLQEILDNPKRVAEYKSQTADFICNKYNWDNVVEKTLGIYKKK